MVSITLRVLSRPDVEHLPKIYQSLGMDYDERVLPSIGNEVLKSIVAQFDAAELITQREVVCSAKDRKFPSGVDLDLVRCRQGFVKISCSVLENLISSLKTSQLRT
jgi:regulator of protease activity HflC (stomatin/prohibitin superfamily)